MINLLPVFARKNQQTTAAERFMNCFRHALANPVQIGTLALIEVEEGKYRYRIGGPAEGRGRQSPDKKKRNQTHFLFRLSYLRGRAREVGARSRMV